MSFFCDVDTKLEAYKLVYDPTKLLTLLYLKYGDVEEDYYLLYANQVVYNKPSHFNAVFKERQFNDEIDEFLKRKYKLKEAKERIPKLSDYYKNYHLFFCKPTFINFYFYKLMHSYEEQKAEIFYKNNYENENSKNEETEKEIKQKTDSSSLSSLDDITDNKIIFTKMNKKIIDNNLDSNMYSLTFTLESLKNNNSSNFGLISKRSQNDSFEKVLKNFVNYQNKKKEKKNKEKNKKIKENEQKNIKKKNLTTYMRKRKKKVISQKSYKNINSKTNNKIKNSLNTLERKNFSTNKTKAIKTKIRKNNSHSKNNIFFSAKIDKNFFSKLSSKIEEFQKNKQHDIQNNNYNHKRNKTYSAINNQISSMNNKNINVNVIKNQNNINLNNNISNFKTFSKLSKILNNNKVNIKTNKNYNNINSNNFNNTMKNKKITKNNIYKNVDQFLTVNNDQLNNNVDNLKRKKNKTFDFNIINNNNNQKTIASSNIHSPSTSGTNNKGNYKIIDITKNKQKKNSFGGSKFNLVKGSIVNIIKKPQSTNIQNLNNNLLNKLNINYSSNFNHYKNNTKHFNSNYV